MAISPDANVVRETTFPTFLEVVEQTGQLTRYVTSPTPKIWFRTLDGGIANIIFKGAEKPDKLRGPNKAGVWFDEASVISKKPSKLRSPAVGGAVVWAKSFARSPLEDSALDIRAIFLADRRSPSRKAEWKSALVPWPSVCGSRRYSARQVCNSGQSFRACKLRRANRPQLLVDAGPARTRGGLCRNIGLMFRHEFFRFVDEAPRDAVRIRYWDRAATPGGGCYTAGF